MPAPAHAYRAVPAACPGAFTRARICRFCDALHAYPGSRIIIPDLHTNSGCHANTMFLPKQLAIINSTDPSKQPVTNNSDLVCKQLVTGDQAIAWQQNVTRNRAIRSKQRVTIPGSETSLIHDNKMFSLQACFFGFFDQKISTGWLFCALCIQKREYKILIYTILTNTEKSI